MDQYITSEKPSCED